MSQKKENKRNVPNLTTFDTVSASSKKSTPVLEPSPPDQPVVSLSSPNEKAAPIPEVIRAQEEAKTYSAPNLSSMDSEKLDSKKADFEKTPVIARQAKPGQRRQQKPRLNKAENQTPKAQTTNAKTPVKIQAVPVQTVKINHTEKKDAKTPDVKMKDAQTPNTRTQSRSAAPSQPAEAAGQKTTTTYPSELKAMPVSQPVVASDSAAKKTPTPTTAAQQATTPPAMTAPRIVAPARQDAPTKADSSTKVSSAKTLPAQKASPTKDSLIKGGTAKNVSTKSVTTKKVSPAKSAKPKVSRPQVTPTKVSAAKIPVSKMAKAVPTKIPAARANPVLPQDVQDMLTLTHDSCSEAMKAGMTVSKGLENVGMRMSGYIGRSAKSGVDFSRLLLHATTFKDVVSLHANFTGNVIEDFFEESRKIADIGFSTSAQSLNPIHEKAAQTWTTLCNAVDFQG